VALALAAGSTAASNGAKVSITDSGFKPAVVTIKQWQVVTWTNDGKSQHGVFSNTESTLKSGSFDPGQAYANLFKKSGSFAYHDPLHPSFTGRVVVVAAPKPRVTGPNPPSGKKPKGFHPQASGSASGTATLTERDTRTNWAVVGGAFGAAAVVLAAAIFLLVRRRRPAG
jgi:plastocyanin